VWWEEEAKKEKLEEHRFPDQVLIREASLSAIDKACMKEHYS